MGCDLCRCRNLLTHKGAVFGSALGNFKFFKSICFQVVFCTLSLRDSGGTHARIALIGDVSPLFPAVQGCSSSAGCAQ